MAAHGGKREREVPEVINLVDSDDETPPQPIKRPAARVAPPPPVQNVDVQLVGVAQPPLVQNFLLVELVVRPR